MTLKLTIKMDNAAFEDEDIAGQRGFEAARILHKAADKLGDSELDSAGVLFSLLDINGNRVGEARVTR